MSDAGQGLTRIARGGMPVSFYYDKDAQGIVTVTMDMAGQSANTMSEAYHVLMGETVSRLEAEEGLKGVVIASAKKTFFAGGDLKGLLAMDRADDAYLAWLEKEKGYLRRLEKLSVPVVAAINGAALGGGFEICLACNHRILLAHPSAIVGLPEVTLGLLPGAGGVVRLTALLGFEKALPYLTQGLRLPPEEALREGFVDALSGAADELVAEAKAWIVANPNASTQPWDRPGFRHPGDAANVDAVAAATEEALAGRPQSTAARKTLQIALKSLTTPFDAALRYETELFCTLLGTPENKAAIQAFFAANAERKAREEQKVVSATTA